MKIEKKFADLKNREKRDKSEIKYIVIQPFQNKDTSHYHIMDNKVYQILPDSCISDSVSGGKLNRLGVYHGICTRFNSVSISVKDYPDKKDIELCKHLIMTIRQRYNIRDNDIIRQTDITGEIGPEIWFNNSRWNEDIIQGLKDMLDN